MKDWVQQKLEQIEILYPPERVAKSKERWRRLWAGEAPLDRYPVAFYPITVDYYSVIEPEERLRIYLDEMIWRGRVQDDFIPAFFPGCHQGTIPGMFGAKEIVANGDTYSERLVMVPEDIHNLPEPEIKPGMIAHRWLELERYFMEETAGRLPCHVTDMQGPADVCGQLWGYDNLLAAPYTDPEYYEEIMTKVTEAFILLWQKQIDVIGEDQFIGTHLFGWDWVPKGNGATASVDSMVMVSPQFFMDHMAPYLARIAQAFGGLVIHSCGNFAQLVPRLGELPYLKGINASQMSVRDLVDAGLDKRLVIVATADMNNVEESFAYIKAQGLKVDLTVAIWNVAPEKAGKPELWDENDWQVIRTNAGKVLELARV